MLFRINIISFIVVFLACHLSARDTLQSSIHIDSENAEVFDERVLSDSLKENDSLVYEKENESAEDPEQFDNTRNKVTDWTRNSFWVTLFGCVSTLTTIIVMIAIYKKQSLETEREIAELKRQNNHTLTQIKNQERLSREESIRSNNLNKSLKGNVQAIKHYMLEKDLIIKITEKKASIYNTFVFISGTNFSGSELKRGTLLANTAVLEAAIKIDRDLTIVSELLPNKSDTFNNLAAACHDDLNSLSVEHDNVLKWISEAQDHFKQLNDELNKLINNLRHNFN